MKNFLRKSLFSFILLGLGTNLLSQDKKLISNPPSFLNKIEVGAAYDTFYQDYRANGGRIVQRGVNFSGAYEYALSNQFTTHFRPNLSIYSEEVSAGDVDTIILKHTQSINYHYRYKDITLRPFVDGSLGWGFESLETSQAEIKINGLVAELGLGLALKMDNGLIPYLRLSYRYFDADRGDYEMKNGVDRNDEKTNLKNHSRNVQLGMLYQF